ncbi:hypothetical protein [Rosistilla oblonga]|uniref:hypothetical protein n=1 Tax=Rosistilla oblonga TaxID=2527990 RepID=UPI003A982D10
MRFQTICNGIVLTGLLLLAGCGDEQTAKTSLFEHDHEVAEHWPDNFADAAVKLRQRLDASADETADAKQAEAEIADIVSWVPEIAADTDLSEQDWIPLDNAAESLMANLRSSGNELTDANRKQTVAFCELIEEAIAKLPAPIPSPQGASL